VPDAIGQVETLRAELVSLRDWIQSQQESKSMEQEDSANDQVILVAERLNPNLALKGSVPIEHQSMQAGLVGELPMTICDPDQFGLR
jgi:hypothetical protein